MRFIYLLILYIIGTVFYDVFAPIEDSTNWSILYNATTEIFIIGCILVNARRILIVKQKKLLYGIAGVIFFELVMMLLCIGMPFEEYNKIMSYSCYFDYGALLILIYFLYDYGIHNKDTFRWYR